MSSLLAALSLATGGQVPSPVVVQSAPAAPILLHHRDGPHAPASPPQQQLARWMMRPVVCGQGDGNARTVAATVRAPDPQRFMTWSRVEPRRTLTVTFRIDESGRPLSIQRLKASEVDYVPDAQDVLPALAASRFAPGAARTGCTATFFVETMPIAAASIEDLMAFSVFPTTAPTKAMWDRIIPAGSDCTKPAPEVLVRAFPAFKTLPDQPGYRTWSMTGYDLDASGKPRNVRTVAGSNVAALDGAARGAVAKSRFEPGARVGCFYPYYKNAAILPPPLAPEEEAMRPTGSTCPREHDWDRKPRLTYPAAYATRRIEGWAMVRYDVAPWGQIGNVHVLQAEPTSEFGEAAATMMSGATFKTGGNGYVGCVDRVRYVMPKPGGALAPDAPEPGSY